MKLIRAVLRLILLLLHVLLGIGLTAVFAVLLNRSDNFRMGWRQLVQWWQGRVIRILGGMVTVKGEPLRSGALLVSNHVSWLDIPLLGGQSFVRFLSKQDVEKWPVIGWLATRAGTLYIERGRRGAAEEAAQNITESLIDGDVVLVFPEGTTSDGHGLLPFHARLFSSATAANAPVQPVAIRYCDAQGQISDKAAYIGNMSLLESVMGLLGEKRLHIEVHYLPVINDVQQTRKTLAKLSEDSIMGALAQG